MSYKAPYYLFKTQ